MSKDPALVERAREQFESWITKPPFERDTELFSDDPSESSWPGQYRDYPTQLAWCAWQAAIDRTQFHAAEPNAAPLPQDGSGDGNDAVSQAGYKEGGAAPDTELVGRLRGDGEMFPEHVLYQSNSTRQEPEEPELYQARAEIAHLQAELRAALSRRSDGYVMRAILSIASMLIGGFLAQWIFTDIPQWGISLHAILTGMCTWIACEEKP